MTLYGARVVGENLQALAIFEGLPTGTLAFIYLAIVAAIVYRGIRESMWANVALTLMEAGGLLLVIAVSLRFWGSANLLEFPVGPETEAGLPLVFLVVNSALVVLKMRPGEPPGGFELPIAVPALGAERSRISDSIRLGPCGSSDSSLESRNLDLAFPPSGPGNVVTVLHPHQGIHRHAERLLHA